MRSILLVAACLACAGHARRMQLPIFQQHVEEVAARMRENGDVPDSKVLATLLLASSPKSAFTLSGPRTQPVTPNRNSGVKMQSFPDGQDNPLEELQAQVAALQKSKQKIAEVQAQLAALQQQQQLQQQQEQQRQQQQQQQQQPVPGEPAAGAAPPLFAQDPPVDVAQSRDTSLPVDDLLSQGSDIGAPPRSGRPSFAPRKSESPFAPRRSESPFAPRKSDLDEQFGHESFGQSRDKPNQVTVQGGSLKTWSYTTSVVDRVQVVLNTDGRPLDADIQLWQGPDNTPCKMKVYSEDGNNRPFSAVIATPNYGESTVAIYNIGQIEFPLSAYVTTDDLDEPIADFRDTSIIVQGGALRTFNFNPAVASVEVVLKTDGRPLNARVELLQGPNNIKQVIELYTENGLERPFFAIIDSMGDGNVVRVVNTAPLEFPMFASVEAHSIDDNLSFSDPIVGGG